MSENGKSKVALWLTVAVQVISVIINNLPN